MAISLHQVVVTFALIFTWCWMVKARLSYENPENSLQESPTREEITSHKSNRFFLTNEYVPEGSMDVGRSFRAPRKVMQPRATRMGDFELFTARGYGKRSAVSLCGEGTPCRKHLPFFGARRWGKRDLRGTLEDKKFRRFICLLTNCDDINYTAVYANLNKMAHFSQKKLKPLQQDETA